VTPDPKVVLRDYQTQAIEGLHRAFSGQERPTGTGVVRRPAVVRPTGMGKTHIFTHPSFWRPVVGDRKRMVVLVHRDELADQTVSKLRAADPTASIGRVQGIWDETDRQVIVASVQTLARSGRRSRLDNVGLVVVDECFPAGTMVGTRPIESIRVGDVVASYDEWTGDIVDRRVTATMRRTPSAMVRVRLSNGRTFACTPNHPLMTLDGWCPAGLSRGAYVLSFTHDAIAQGAGRDGLRQVRDGLRGTAQAEDRRLASIGSGVLPGLLPGRLGEQGRLGADGSHESSARLGAHAGEQPDGAAGIGFEDETHDCPDRTSATRTGWEWKAGAGAAAQARPASGVADRGGRGAVGRRAAVPLQAGHRPSDDEGLCRGGRGIPLFGGTPRIGRAPGRTPGFARVVDVQVLEPGGDGTYGGVCRDGAVYNLEVDGTHTYLIDDGVVAHNCHHAVAPTYVQVMTHFGCFASGEAATPTAGFTATMSRSKEDEHLGNIWQEVVLKRDVLDGIRSGNLVDVIGKRVEITGLDLDGVKRSHGDFSERDLGEHLMAADAPEQVAKAYIELARDRQGIAFWPDLDSADQGAAAFRDHGIVTEVIKGETETDERRDIYQRYRLGQVQMLSSCMVLTEGFDMPQASAAVIARPTESAGLFVQMAGRVLRPWKLPVPGYGPKRNALLLDVAGVTSRHKLATIADLSVAVGSVDTDRGESLAEAAERELAAVECRAPSVPVRHTIFDVDLFGARASLWLQTPRGTWFIPVGDYVVFLWPGDHGLWQIGITLMQGGPGRAQLVADGMTLEWATERAEAWANEIGGRTGSGALAKRDAAWRKRKEASRSSVSYATSLGCQVSDGATQAQVSDLISVALTASTLGG
jgi:superfamily II DNA or RNA helicase